MHIYSLKNGVKANDRKLDQTPSQIHL